MPGDLSCTRTQSTYIEVIVSVDDAERDVCIELRLPAGTVRLACPCAIGKLLWRTP